MEALTIGTTTVKLDTKALAQGAYDLHAEMNQLGPLAFGMLNATIMESMETNLKARVYKEFEHSNPDGIFNGRIEDYLKKVNKKIVNGIYQRATMVV